MKNVYSLLFQAFLSVALFLAGCSYAFASHIMGSDITFLCTGGNQYQVMVTLYRDCSGISVSSTISVDVTSSCGSQTVTCSQDPLRSGVEVSGLCPTVLSTCQGGNYPGVEVYTYTGTVTVPPNCGVVTFSYGECCRNTSNNISNSLSMGFGVQATLNSDLTLCETAPFFTSLPVPYFCVGQPANYSHGAVDVDGDSLVYTLIPPTDELGNPLAYSGTFNATNPMPTASGFNFDTHTGQMSFTPTQVGVYVVDVLVSEYRNGQLVGTTMRDIQIVVINCQNDAPRVSSCLSTANVTGGVVEDCNSLGVCPGSNLSFTIGAKDPNGQAITVSSNIASSIPGATLTTTQVGGPDSVLVTFNWMPLGTDTGFRYFTIQFKDNACPLPGIQLFTYDITVLSGITVGPDKSYCTGGGPVTVYATGGNHFSWTPTTGMVNANPDSSVISFAPAATTTYYVQSDLQGGCKTKDTITIYKVSTFNTSTSASDDTICLNASTTVSVTAVPASQGPFTYSWGPANTGVMNPSSQTTMVRPDSTTTYHVTVTSASGCVITNSKKIVIQGVAPKVVVNPSENFVCPGAPVTLNTLVRALDCGPNSNPQNPCLPGSQFVLQDIGTGAANAGTGSSPFTGLWDDGRIQYLFRASELQAIGLSAGTITDIALNVASKSSSQPYNSLTIKMGCTSLSGLTTSFVPSLTQVVNPINYTVATGWNTFTLDVPYNWDGFSNLVIEICYDNSTWTSTDNVFYTTTSFANSVLYNIGDLPTASGCSALNSPTLGQSRADMRFIMCAAPLTNYTFDWTASDGSQLPNIATPTVDVYHNVTYTVTIDDGTCQGDTTFSLYVDSGVLVSAGQDTVVCNGKNVTLNGSWLHPVTPVCGGQYFVAPVPYALATPQGSVTNVTNFSSLDDGTTPPIPMPFPFSYYCQPVTVFYINANGFVSFMPVTGTTYITQTLPNSTAPNGVLALFWRDLNLANSGTVSYFVNGTAPNRVLVIQFLNVAWYGGTSSVSGQLQIYENGNIEMHQTSFTTGIYTMGIENNAGTVATAIPGANGQAVTFAGPRAFRFTPLMLGAALQSVVWTPSADLSSDTILTPVASPQASTDYVLTATFSNGCVTHDTVSVRIGTFPFTVGVDKDTICQGDTAQLLFNGNGESYVWTTGTGIFVDSVKNPLVAPTTSTSYLVTSFNADGCRGDDTVAVSVVTPTPVDLGQDQNICGCDTAVVLAAGVPGTYVWSTNDTTASVRIDTSGVYSLTVTDQLGCVVKDTVAIEIHCLVADAAVTDPATGAVMSGQNASLDVNTNYSSVFGYSWNPSAFLNDTSLKSPTAENILNTTTYTVFVYDEDFGCVASDTVTVSVIPPGLVPMPNAFTPNGDGKNDVFGPVIPASLQRFWSIDELRIYDRWGQLVFKGNTSWDGNWKGALQPSGTYVYYITLIGPDQNHPQNNIPYNLTGSFTLLR